MTHPSIDHTHDPELRSWVTDANGHAEFPIQNLPFGVFSQNHSEPAIGVAIGDHIFDLKSGSGLLPSNLSSLVRGVTLNALMGASSEDRLSLRHALSALLADTAQEAVVRPHLRKGRECEMHLPAAVGDYTDFYVGIHHAENVGRLFRPDNPLLPNYKYVPIGYHGRASSIRASGVPVIRPRGQRKVPNAEAPEFAPTQRLDYELELGVWIGPGNTQGQPIPIASAPQHIAGLCLLNDWSARDFQAWEYQPLGPFLSKNFHSTISPWVVTAEALAPFRIAQPARPDSDPQPLPYLWDAEDQNTGALAITLEVSLRTEKMRQAAVPPQRLSRGPASNMYWTIAQIVAHHTSNGCNLTPGDLLGTGTISGPSRDGFGSLIEMSRGGAEPITLDTGEARAFLEDGDEVIMTARATAEGYASIGFGHCAARIVPAQ